MANTFNNMRIGIGDGSTRVFPLPVTGSVFFTCRVADVEVFCGPDYEILNAAADLGLDYLVFRTPPANGSEIRIDVVDAATYYHLFTSLDVVVKPMRPRVAVEAF